MARGPPTRKCMPRNPDRFGGMLGGAEELRDIFSQAGRLRQTPVGLLFIGEENLKLNPSKVGIILEGNVVMDDLANLPQAFCVLFGLIYALHLDYPKYMKNTFCFVQQVMLNLGKSELAAKIQTLKNQLTV
ncbi:hypothetical protein C0J45_4619 [Silurus meridionalis]|nr:hypothetical protein C0J45_4619 [Silurus meridionalis]